MSHLRHRPARRVSGACALAVAAGLLVPAVAAAHGSRAGLSREGALAVPPPGAGRRAYELVQVLETKLGDGRLAATLARPLANARHALERAAGARAAGDRARANLLDALALEWAETARDLERAVQVESEAERKASEAEALRVQAERTRALVAELVAQKQQLQLELQKVEGESRSRARPAAEKSSSPAKAPAGPKARTDANRVKADQP